MTKSEVIAVLKSKMEEFESHLEAAVNDTELHPTKRTKLIKDWQRKVEEAQISIRLCKECL